MPLQPSNALNSSSVTEHRVAGSLPSAILLAITGGSLDAFIYVNHGHVFAASMTGNGILLGVAILHHDWMQATRHLLPIFGFILGIFFANLLNTRLKHHAVTIGLLCEITALFIASFLPGHFPDLIFVPIIAIVAAYQIASFRQVDTYSYNSTFITSNLRTAVDGLYDAFDPAHRKAGLRQFRKISFIVLAFLLGATAGAILAPHLYNHTLWLIDLPLVAVLLMVFGRSKAGATKAPNTLLS